MGRVMLVAGMLAGLAGCHWVLPLSRSPDSGSPDLPSPDVPGVDGAGRDLPSVEDGKVDAQGWRVVYRLDPTNCPSPMVHSGQLQWL